MSKKKAFTLAWAKFVPDEFNGESVDWWIAPNGVLHFYTSIAPWEEDLPVAENVAYDVPVREAIVFAEDRIKTICEGMLKSIEEHFLSVKGNTSLLQSGFKTYADIDDYGVTQLLQSLRSMSAEVSQKAHLLSLSREQLERLKSLVQEKEEALS